MLALLFLPAVVAAQGHAAPKRVLVLYWYGKDFPSNASFDQNIKAVFETAPAGTVEYYAEYLESDRFPGESQSTLMRNYLRQKYADRKIDVVVALSSISLDFLIKNRRELFHDAAIVFQTFNQPALSNELRASGITGVVTKNAFAETVELALQLHPDTKRVFVVDGSSSPDKALDRDLGKTLKKFEGRAQFIYLSDLPLEELLASVRAAPRQSIVLYVRYSLDSTGKALDPFDALSLVAQSAAVPVYSLSGPIMIGRGSVGGYSFDLDRCATDVALMALRIANGAKPQDVPVMAVPNVPRFDWRQLRRWGINENQLPAGSVVLFREPTFWQRYKWRVVGVMGLFLLQSLLIAGLLLERNRRLRAAEHLAESEERYRNVVECQTDLICRYLPDTTLTFVNDAYCQFFERKREALIGTKFIELIPTEAREAVLEQLRTLINFSRVETHEHEVIRPNGATGWHQWINHAITDAEGNVIELQGIGRDITERKEAETALKDSEERNRAILSAMPDLMFLQSGDGVYLDYHARHPALLAVPPDQFLGRRMQDVLPPDLASRFTRSFAQARNTGETQLLEYDLWIDREHQWYEARIAPCNSNKILSVVRNITERKRAAEELTVSEDRFAKAFKVNPQPMSLTTFEEGRYIDVNDSFISMSGYTRQEVIGYTSKELKIWETPTSRANMLQELTEHGAIRNLETKFRTKNGDFRVLLSSVEQMRVNGERCILVASSDITERKRLEEKLRLSEREFSTLVDNSPDIISRLDQDLNYIYVSQALERSFGIPKEKFIGRPPREVTLPGYDWQHFENSCRTVFATGRQESREFSFGGRSYRSRIIPEFSSDNDVESVMVISEDVTERLRAEQELQKLTVRLFTLQDEERRRIARELHDGAAQNLFGISLNLGNLQRGSVLDNESVRLVEECQSLADQSLQELRTLSYLLHPPLLDQAGLVSALQWYVEGFTKRSGIYVDLIAFQDIGRLPLDIETALFRIVQESLTNIHRHSGSETASIRLERHNQEVMLKIADRGGGIRSHDDSTVEEESPQLGVGIPGMRQRLLQLGGQLDITSNDRGTIITAVVPAAEGALNGKHSAG